MAYIQTLWKKYFIDLPKGNLYVKALNMTKFENESLRSLGMHICNSLPEKIK